MALLSAEEARAQQNKILDDTSGSNYENEITKNLLSKIQTNINAGISAGKSYSDFQFSIFSKTFMETLIEWIDVDSLEDEPTHGNTDSIWNKHIHAALDEQKYGWAFIYKLDAEVPYGIRISWYNGTDDAQNPLKGLYEDVSRRILPLHKYTTPPADVLEENFYTPASAEDYLTIFKSFFENLSQQVKDLMREGKSHIVIPWGSFEGACRPHYFFNKKDGVRELDPTKLVNEQFMFGKKDSSNDHYYQYNSTEYYKFTEIDLIEKIMQFFKDTSWEEPWKEAYDPGTNNVTLHSILNGHLGYKIYPYELRDMHTGIVDCAGLIITWPIYDTDKGQLDYPAINTIADTLFSNSTDAYNQYVISQNLWESTSDPNWRQYELQSRRNNTKYLTTLLSLIQSKMATAFERGDRVITILWTELNSSFPEAVRDNSWSNGMNRYAGTIKTSHGEVKGRSVLLDDDEDDNNETAQYSLKYALWKLMKIGYLFDGHNYNDKHEYTGHNTKDSAIPFLFDGDQNKIKTNAIGAFNYVRYKKLASDKKTEVELTQHGTFDQDSVATKDKHPYGYSVSRSNSCGLVIALIGNTSGDNDGGIADLKSTCDAMKTVQEKQAKVSAPGGTT